ncbi:MAG: hypothetical protein JSR89_13010 [Proteobacteria bacterium]|nr:hypothetical protein [Pseudomonadota bacterium]
MSPERKRVGEAHQDEATTTMLLEIRKHIVEETVSMNPVFDYDGLDEEVARALINPTTANGIAKRLT